MFLFLSEILILSTAVARLRCQTSVARSDSDGNCKTFSGEDGSCRREKDCPDVMEGRYFPSLCSVSGSKKVGVCCKFTNQAPPPPQPSDPAVRCGIISFSTGNDPSEFLNPRVSSPASSDTTEVRAIVNGERTAKASQPWTVALGNLQPGTERVQFVCGGSLVSLTSVLTSAHCLEHLGGHTVVLLGQTDLAREEAGTQVRTVQRSLVHPDWSGSAQHDLALVYLDSPVTPTDRVRPVCLPAPSHTASRGLISGWGRLYSGGPAVSELRTGEVEILTAGDCLHMFPHLARAGGVLCARGLQTGRSSLATDACQGDSGGPLVTEDDITGLWRLAGVVTAGKGCGQYPGVYVSVRHHLDWIHQHLVSPQ